MGLGEKLSNTNSTIYIAVMIWWIVCLWRDEPGTVRDASTGALADGKDSVEPDPALIEAGSEAGVEKSHQSE